MRWAIRRLVAIVVLAYFSSHGIAYAAADGIRPVSEALELVPGATCLDEKRLEGHVSAWLGWVRIPSDIRVIVEGDPQQPLAAEFRISRQGAVRRRRFEPTPADCEETHAVIALAIALAIDAGVLERVAAFVAPAPPRRLFTFQAGGAYAIVPAFSLGLAMGFEHGLLPWLGARASAFAQHSRGNQIDGSAGNFDVTLLAGELALCAGQGVNRETRLSLCSGVAAGSLLARGRGYDVPRSSAGIWAALATGLRFEALVAIPWVVDLALAVPWRSPAFRVERPGGDGLLEPKPLGLLFYLGPGVEL